MALKLTWTTYRFYGCTLIKKIPPISRGNTFVHGWIGILPTICVVFAFKSQYHQTHYLPPQSVGIAIKFQSQMLHISG